METGHKSNGLQLRLGTAVSAAACLWPGNIVIEMQQAAALDLPCVLGESACAAPAHLTMQIETRKQRPRPRRRNSSNNNNNNNNLQQKSVKWFAVASLELHSSLLLVVVFVNICQRGRDPHHQLLPRASAFCFRLIDMRSASNLRPLKNCDAALLLASPPAAPTPPAPLGVAAQSLGHNLSFSHLHSHIHSIICLFACKQTETVRYTG